MKSTLHLFLAVVFTISTLLIVTPAQAQLEDLPFDMPSDQENMKEEDMQEMMKKLGMNMPKEIKPGTYNNEIYAYAVEVPEDWTGIEMPPSLLMVFKGDIEAPELNERSQAFMVISGDDEENDFKNKDIEDIDIDEYRAEVEKQMKEDANAGDVEIETMERTEVNGRPAIHVLQRMKIEGEDAGEYEGWLKAEMYVFEHNDEGISILYMSPEEEWENFKPFVDKHVKTLAFE